MLDPRIEITKEDFMEVYERVAYFQMFKQIPEVADGFKQEHLNLCLPTTDGPEAFEGLLAKREADSQRGLTEIQMERQK